MLATTFAAPALADPNPPVFPSQKQVTDAKAAAGSAAGQVAQLDAQLSASRERVLALATAAAKAGEESNGAQAELDAATAAAADASRIAADAKTKSDAAAVALSKYAAAAYQSGGTGQLDAYFGGGPQDVLDRAAGLQAVGNQQARAMADADAARQLSAQAGQAATEAQTRKASAAANAAAAFTRAQQAQQQAQSESAAIATQQQAMTVQLASLQQTSVQLEQQRQDGLAAQEQARQEALRKAAADEAARKAAQKQAADEAARKAAAKAAADAAAANNANNNSGNNSGSNSGSSTKPTTPSNPPPVVTNPPRGGTAAVLDYARAQLGKPYVWGAAGPGTFDCSGLTMMAWRQAGVYLGHYTGTQWNQTQRVPLSQLQPGDLVFYGSTGPGSYHVGLYIGGGQMIHAPNPSTVVKVSSIYIMGDLLPYGGRP